MEYKETFEQFKTRLTGNENLKRFDKYAEDNNIEMTIETRLYIYYLNFATQLSKMNKEECKKYDFTFYNELDHNNKAIKYIDRYINWLRGE